MRAVLVYGPNEVVVAGTGVSPPPEIAPGLPGIERGVPMPVREQGELMVRASSTSVNPVDTAVCRGHIRPAKGYPKIVGGDIAGIVEEADDGSRFKPGDRVAALTPGFFDTQEGTWADFSSVPEHMLAHVPATLPLSTAGAIPLVGLTAWQALQDGSPKPFKRVLVHAAAGGVGTFAVQIAKALGMYVAGTAGPNNLDFVVNELGADEAVDYTVPHWEQAYKDKPFDIAIDPLGTKGDATKKSVAVLKPGGHLSHIMNDGTDKQLLNRIAQQHDNKHGPSVSTIFVQPNGQQLAQVLQLMEQGKVKLFVDRVWPLERAMEGVEHMEKGHTRGKVVLQMQQGDAEAPAGEGVGSRM